MLQHRMSPAALFSELAIALDMVVDSQLPPADAERVALACTHKCRRLLYEASLNKPLKQGDEASFEDAMAIFLRTAYAYTRWVATTAPTRTRRRVRTSTRVLSAAASSVVTRQATCTSTWRAYEYPWQCSPSPAPPEALEV